MSSLIFPICCMLSATPFIQNIISSHRLHFSPLDANKRYQSYQERCETINTDDRETKCPHKFIPWPWNKDGEDVSELIEVNVSHVS